MRLPRVRWTARRTALVLVGVSLPVVFLAAALWPMYPPLSATEARLLGVWTIPEFNPRIGYVTPVGPVTHPQRVWEFRRDRSFRVWIVSADDPRVSIFDLKGRWRVVEGRLQLAGAGGGEGIAWEFVQRIRVWFGRPYIRRVTGNGPGLPIRFSREGNLTTRGPGGNELTWERRR